MPLEKGTKIHCLDHGHVIYVDHMGSDHDICAAARVSYNKADVVKTPEDDQRLINRLYRDRHTSPFEMAKVVFNIKLPIFCERQRVRHRMQNMNEVSARYTELPEEFYIPTDWRKQDTKNRQGSEAGSGLFTSSDGENTYSGEQLSGELRRICGIAFKSYKAMLDAGVAREMARMVLPLNIYTEVRCCWDMKNALDFIRLREDLHAQEEIRAYTSVIKAFLTELFPMVMSAYERYKFTITDTQQLKTHEESGQPNQDHAKP